MTDTTDTQDITATTPTAEEKREELKARIAAAQEREEARAEQSFTEKAGEKASEATDAFTGFVKEHPIAAAAGGVVLGVLIAGMFKGPRRAAAADGAKAVGLAAIGAEIASGFASQLMDDASDLGRAGKHRAVDFSDSVGDRSRALGRRAKHRAGDTADAVSIARRETGKAIARAMGRR